MIERVRFQNFRALRNVEVDLTPLTVIVGPNASGKTSVLDGTHIIAQFASSSEMPSGLRALDRVKSVGCEGPIKLTAEGCWDNQSGSLGLTIEVHTDPETREVTPGDHLLMARWGQDQVKIDPRQDSLTRRSEMKALCRAFGGGLLLRLSVRSLVAPSYVEGEVPRISPEGEGLASVLNDLVSSKPEAMAAIEGALQAVVPAIRRVRTERASVRRTETEHVVVDGQSFPRIQQRKYWGHRVVLDTTSGAGIPIEAASEGTVLTLGLLTVLHGRNPPRVLLLDDIDRALHPKAQEDLVAQLRQIMAARPELQIIATSHSPYLLDALQFKEVRLTTLRDDGSAACAPLTSHPEYVKWKDHVKPGELWTSEAESWVAARSEQAP